MTPLATHVSAFLRERLPLEIRASERTCETYALALRLFFEYTAKQLKVRPSDLRLDQNIDDNAARISRTTRKVNGVPRGKPAFVDLRQRASVFQGAL